MYSFYYFIYIFILLIYICQELFLCHFIIILKCIIFGV